jgi:hypothetical protein
MMCNVGLISRYVLVAALATITLVVLTTVHRPQWSRRYLTAGVVALSLITHAIGGGKADQVHRSYAPLNLAAVALRVDAPAALDALHIQRGAAPPLAHCGRTRSPTPSLSAATAPNSAATSISRPHIATANGPSTAHGALVSRVVNWFTAVGLR